MNLLAFAAATALRLLDPTGDAAGDGTLLPPTSPAYANVSVFDLQEVTLTPGATEGEPTTIGIAMGTIELTDALPAGFNRVVIDVYVDAADGGAEATLEGPSLLMPPGRGWEYAVRVSPRGAFGAVAPLDPAAPVEWQPLPLALEGDVFVVVLPWDLTVEADVYVVSGLFDAFSPSGWRGPSRAPSAWSFSSEEQTSPVVDVLAVDQGAQERVLTVGVLPAPAARRDSGLPWLLLAIAGVLVAMYGLWLRRRVPGPVVATGLPAVEEEPAAADGAELGTETTADGMPPAEEQPAMEEVRTGEPSPTREADLEATSPAGAAAEEADGPAIFDESTADEPSEPPATPKPLVVETDHDVREVADADGDTSDSDALAAAWSDEEEEEDDLARFLTGDARGARELWVEHSEDEEG